MRFQFAVLGDQRSDRRERRGGREQLAKPRHVARRRDHRRHKQVHLRRQRQHHQVDEVRRRR